MKPRRSMLFIPGANAAMLSTSFVYGADAVMFDLEDAVSLREKDTARLLCIRRCSIHCIRISKPWCALTRLIRRSVLPTLKR